MRDHGFYPAPSSMLDVPIAEIFSRIGALETEVRRLTILHEIVLGRTEDIASRKEMNKMMKELYRTSGRVGDLVTRVNVIDPLRKLIIQSI